MRTVTVLVVALMVSNLLLVGLLLWERSSLPVLPVADAQVIARGGKYLAAVGNYTSSRQCLYLIDETNDQMIVYFWDDVDNTLRRLAYTNVREDFQRGAQLEERGRRGTREEPGRR